jgi:S-ribosylhomocysteine lyase LuxS involved in autoinducer biosynthesis
MKSKAEKLTRYSPRICWGGTELSMLGRWPDKEIAKITRRTLAEVIEKRESLRIPAQNLS